MKQRYRALCAGLLALGLSATADAALESRLGGAAVFDTDLNITWLADANLANSNSFGVSGINTGAQIPGAMSGATAQSWLDAMNAANYLGFNDWRRPVTLTPDASCSFPSPPATGSGCTGSEMGHLFYEELGGTAGQSILTSGDPDLALFSNIRPVYSSSTSFDANNGYEFTFNSGFQVLAAKTTQRFVWAVRSGDVTPIPEPSTALLLAAGLATLLFAMRGRFARER